jgi:PST family polysaccharide transporter
VAVSLAWSGLLALTAFICAPLVAAFFHRPEVSPMFRALSVALLLRGAAEVPDALLRKHLRFRRRMGIDVARVAAQGAVSVALAVAGAGPWAIVGGYLAANAAWSVASWALVDYRPQRSFWRVSWSEARPLLAFGIPAAINVVVLTLVFDVDYLIVGRVLGVRALGLYTLAFRVPDLLIVNVFVALSAVVFPVFSRLQGDRARLRAGYLSAVRFQSAYGLMAGAGLAALAPLAVPVVFGRAWAGAVAPLQALALYAAFRSVGVGSVDLYKALGRPRLALALSCVRFLAVVPAVLLATGLGITGVAWTQAVVALALAILLQAVACRVLGIRGRTLASVLGPGALAALAVAIAAASVGALTPGGDAVRLAAAAGAGLASGLAVLHRFDHSLSATVRSLVGRPGTREMAA